MDHTLEAHFKVTSSCTSGNVDRDQAIIQAMMLSVCPPGTRLDQIPMMIAHEATRVYLMVNAMRLALEDEVRNQTKIEQVD